MVRREIADTEVIGLEMGSVELSNSGSIDRVDVKPRDSTL